MVHQNLRMSNPSFHDFDLVILTYTAGSKYAFDEFHFEIRACELNDIYTKDIIPFRTSTYRELWYIKLHLEFKTSCY